jgi:hypothetical protein
MMTHDVAQEAVAHVEALPRVAPRHVHALVPVVAPVRVRPVVGVLLLAALLPLAAAKACG